MGLSAVAAGVTAGLGQAGAFSGLMKEVSVNGITQYAPTLGSTIARATAGNLITQGIAVASDLQDKFSWSSVAASAVGAAVSYGIGSALGNDAKTFGGKLAMGMGNAGAQASIRGFKNVNWGEVAANAFGSALGDHLVDQIAGGDMVGLQPQQVQAHENLHIETVTEPTQYGIDFSSLTEGPGSILTMGDGSIDINHPSELLADARGKSDFTWKYAPGLGMYATSKNQELLNNKPLSAGDILGFSLSERGAKEATIAQLLSAYGNDMSDVQNDVALAIGVGTKTEQQRMMPDIGKVALYYADQSNRDYNAWRTLAGQVAQGSGNSVDAMMGDVKAAWRKYENSQKQFNIWGGLYTASAVKEGGLELLAMRTRYDQSMAMNVLDAVTLFAPTSKAAKEAAWFMKGAIKASTSLARSAVSDFVKGPVYQGIRDIGASALKRGGNALVGGLRSLADSRAAEELGRKLYEKHPLLVPPARLYVVPPGPSLGAAKTQKLSELGFEPSAFQITDAMNDKAFTKLVKSMRADGIQNPNIKYVVVDGEPYIVHGNNRFLAAKQLGKLGDLQFQRMDFPVKGTNFNTPKDVLDTIGSIRSPRYRGH